jgi:hypothetical protein
MYLSSRRCCDIPTTMLIDDEITTSSEEKQSLLVKRRPRKLISLTKYTTTIENTKNSIERKNLLSSSTGNTHARQRGVDIIG